MSAKNESGLKEELHNTFRNKGFEDMLKTELRSKILEQLKQPQTQKIEITLFSRIVVSLVDEYLTLKNHTYSRSIYLPETGYEGKTLTRSQLISLFTISEGAVDPGTSLLEYFCGFQLPGNLATIHVGCQTNQFEIGYTLEERMQLLEQRQKSTAIKALQVAPIDPVQLKRQVEVELRQHYDRQLRRFKQFEAQSLRLEEAEKARRRYEENRLKIEQTYRRKCDDLRKRERRLMDEHEEKLRKLELQRSEQESTAKKERDILEMRQKVHSEQEKLGFSQKQVELDRIRKMKEQLQQKIKEYDRLNTRAAETVKYQVNVAKLAIQKQYQDKELLTIEHKRAVDEEYYKMLSIKDSVQIIERENGRLVEENKSLRLQLQEIRQQSIQLLNETRQNSQKAEIWREQRTELEKQITELESLFEKESQKTKKLQHELSTARRQLDEARSDLEKAKEELQQRDIEETTPNINVPIPAEQKKSSTEEMNRKIEELRRQRKKQIEKMKMQLAN